jgi:fused signal recognition particle receptor
MFGKLRDKFKSWLKKPEEKPDKTAEAPKEKPPKLVESPKEAQKKEIKKPKEPKKTKKEPETSPEPKAPKKEPELQETPEVEPETPNTTEQVSDIPIPSETSLKPEETLPEEQDLSSLQEEIETSPSELVAPKEPLPEKEPQGGSFFSKLKTKLISSTLSQKQFDEIFQDLEILLLQNNVALEVVDKIRSLLSQDLVNIPIKKSEIDSTIISSLKSAIQKVLIEPPDLIEQIKKSTEPFVILFFGINGSGKTTSVAKLAHYLKKRNVSCVLAAGDTFRAASIEQLQTHADKLSVPLVKQTYGADPAAVAFDAISYAKKHKTQAVLIDTAGRMYTKSNLLKEMEKIVRVSKPDLKIFVGESITGNDATEQARVFSESAGIDGIILSKADVDEKAGTILSVSHVTQKPIYFLGTGQDYEDLTPFSKKTVLKNLGLE